MGPLENEPHKLVLPDLNKRVSFLEEALIRKKQRVVEIQGAPGTGKTFLAMTFATAFQDNFPGGIQTISLEPWLSTEHGKPGTPIIEHGKPSLPISAPHLIIIEDLDSIPSEQAKSYLSEVLQSRRNASIILVGRRHFQSGLVTSSLDLGGPNTLSVRNLLTHFGAQLDEQEAEMLWNSVQQEPRTLQIAARFLRDKTLTLPELLAALKPFSTGGIVDVQGHTISSGENFSSIITDVKQVSDELLKQIARDPSLIHNLSPRRFEEVTAEILNRLGYEVKLTPVSRDGGKDIYVASNNTLGSFLYLVECKKYAPDNHVGIELVQRLHGVVQAERATAGIFVTTSSFTGPAKQFQSLIPYQLSLVDYLGIQKWLRNLLSRPEA